MSIKRPDAVQRKHARDMHREQLRKAMEKAQKEYEKRPGAGMKFGGNWQPLDQYQGGK